MMQPLVFAAWTAWKTAICFYIAAVDSRSCFVAFAACRSAKGKTQQEKIVFAIDIVKGMRNGDRITFEGVANEKPGMLPGDLRRSIVQNDGNSFSWRIGTYSNDSRFCNAKIVAKKHKRY